MSQVGDDRHYVRAVEAAWSKLVGRPAIVSPREFETIDAWRRRGIPLSVVLEVITTAGKRRSGRAPRALTALSKAVEEAWGTVASGRTAPRVAEVLPPRTDATRAWREAMARASSGERLQRLLSTLLDREANGAEAVALDAVLDAALVGAVPDELLKHSTRETERALQEFRGRTSAEEFQKMFARAIVDRLRAELVLPRLALTQ